LQFLLASIAALIVGPLVHELAMRLRPAASRAIGAIDRLLFAVVVALVLVKLLPHVVEDAGWPALVVTALTWGLLFATDRALRDRVSHADQAASWLALGGVAAHEALDGVALATTAGTGLPWVLILHRLTVGLAVWLMLRQLYSRRLATLGLCAVAGVTVAGYAAGTELSRVLEGRWIGFIQAAVAGALLHLAAHRHNHGEPGHGHPHGLEPGQRD
jgi:zinc transporter ZupT